MISLQWSVRSKAGRALSCAMATNEAARRKVSRFLDLFDQPKKHPFDLRGPGIHNRELIFGRQIQVSSKEDVALQFAGGPVTNEEKLLLFSNGRPAVTFDGIRRDRGGRAPNLAGQSEPLLFWSEACDRVRAQRRIVTLPPGEQLDEILHFPRSCVITRDTGLQIKTKTCQLKLRSSYAD